MVNRLVQSLGFSFRAPARGGGGSGDQRPLPGGTLGPALGDEAGHQAFLLVSPLPGVPSSTKRF